MSRRPTQRTQVTRLIRPHLRKLQAYVPGEQPRRRGLIKLNTNENPAPPSPKVLQAVREAADKRLRLYPDPRAWALRERLARRHGCRPENVILGNGSDDLLALATRAFVEPAGGSASEARSTVQFFHPSYSLYPVLAQIHGARPHAVALAPDFSLPGLRPRPEQGRESSWRRDAALSFVTTPNAPSGRGYSTRELRGWCERQRGVVVLDEAYVDFAEENALSLALEFPHVLVSRSFSKAYSLCFLRVGYFVGSAELIAALDKIRDSYNVNGLGQVAALAALGDAGYYRVNFRRIKKTRQSVAAALEAMGFEVMPSQANFLLVRPPLREAEEWLEALRRRRILVRWFRDPAVKSYLRITIGSEEECEALLAAVRGLLRSFARGS